MTTNDFVHINNGKQLADPNGNYLGECVSLWKQYELQVNGIDPADLYVPDDGAKNIWYKTTPAMLKHFDKVTGSPQIGDTVIYDGNYGDVAIYIGNGNVFGQLGTPVFKPAAIRPVGNPLGYLRLKGASQGETMANLSRGELLKCGQVFWGKKLTDAQIANYSKREALDMFHGFLNDPQTEEYIQAITALNSKLSAGSPPATVLKPGTYKVN